MFIKKTYAINKTKTQNRQKREKDKLIFSINYIFSKKTYFLPELNHII